MKILQFTIPLISFLLSTSGVAQEFLLLRRIAPFPVQKESGAPFRLPFLGGLNEPMQQFLDIDGDGDPDLFVKEKRAEQLTFYRNEGTPQVHDFQWVTDAFAGLAAGGWFKFADVDGDGDFDLFVDKPFGKIRYYRNTGSPAAPLFTLAADTLTDETGALITVEGISIPDWADLDCDGVPDLFLGRFNEGNITLYRQTGINAAGVPQYRWVTDHWQDLRIITGGGRSLPKIGESRHGANSLSFVDIDGDGDRDLFWGDFFARSIIFLQNFGTCDSAAFDINAIVEQYPPQDPVITGGYNMPRFADIDADGDWDMFVSVFGGVGSFVKDKADNFYYLENTGTAQQPNHVLQTRRFIDALDLGRNTIPAFVDIDADGDLDLFVGNQEDLNVPNNANSRLYFFENTGTPSAPAFALKNSHYLGADFSLEFNYAPVFADIDADGDADMFLGKWDGSIAFYRNEGSPAAPDFRRVADRYVGIDVGNNATPDFTDIDADGDLDLFIGEAGGTINFYRNQGSAASAAFVLVSEQYQNISLGIQEFSYPKFSDIDGDGDPDLFVGSETRGTLFYRNTGTPQAAAFVADTTFSLPRHFHNAPNWIDIDADGDPDLFLGVDGGGVVFYENRRIVTGIPTAPLPHLPAAIELFQNYPNPFNPQTTIAYRLTANGAPQQFHQKLIIYNLLGQEIRRWEFVDHSPLAHRSVTWDASDGGGNPVPAGVYFYRLILNRHQTRTGKMLLVR